MSRSVGVTDLLAELPGVVVVVFALVTQLGDIWFVTAACLLSYWLGSQTPRLGRGLTRERGATMLGLLACAVALSVSLKVLFAFPRPPGAGTAAYAELVPAAFRDLYASMATGDGYGFPSGHATTTTLVWGGFAAMLRIGTRRGRYAVAGAVVALVALSRLVLGVHYLVDVVAGTAVAGTVLWVAVTRLGRPERVFGFAALVAVGGVLVAGLTRDTAAALGIAAGGALAWTAFPTVPAPTRRGTAITLALGVLSLGAVVTVIRAAGSVAPLVALLAAVGSAVVLTLPLVGERVAQKI